MRLECTTNIRLCTHTEQRRPGIVLCMLLICTALHSCSARPPPSRHHDECGKRVLWFMAITSRSTLEYWRYGKHAPFMAITSKCHRCPLQRDSGSPEAVRNHTQTVIARTCVSAAKVAVLSAKEHSPNLIPVLIYGGSSGEPSAAAHENILWYRQQGGIVYHHNLTFMSELQASKHVPNSCV